MDRTHALLGADDRYQIEMDAAGVERRNRSGALVVCACVVLGVCVLVWLAGWRTKASAVDHLRERRREASAIQGKLVRLEALRADTSQSELGEPIMDMATRLKEIAEAVGVADVVPAPQDRSEPVGGGVVRTYVYDGISAEPDAFEPLIAWMARAEAQIDGLEVFQLTLSPDTNRKKYDVNVTFRRWERQQ